jgi:hypothetical protein
MRSSPTLNNLVLQCKDMQFFLALKFTMLNFKQVVNRFKVSENIDDTRTLKIILKITDKGLNKGLGKIVSFCGQNSQLF